MSFRVPTVEIAAYVEARPVDSRRRHGVRDEVVAVLGDAMDRSLAALP